MADSFPGHNWVVMPRVCRFAGHEWVDSRAKPHALDRVAVVVTITSPPAAKVNKPEKVCWSCAEKIAAANCGFGYGFKVEPVEALAATPRRSRVK